MASRAQKLVSRSVRLEFTQLDDHRTLHNDTNGVGPRASGKQKKIDWIPIWWESKENIELGFWGTFYKSVGWLLNAATFHAMCELIKNKSIGILSPFKLLWNPCNASACDWISHNSLLNFLLLHFLWSHASLWTLDLLWKDWSKKREESKKLSHGIWSFFSVTYKLPSKVTLLSH